MAISPSSATSFLALLFSAASYADDLHVNAGNEHHDGVCNSQCSLAEALAFAAAQPGAHRIVLGPGTFTLPAASAPGDGWQVGGELTLVGAGANRTVLDGVEQSRLFTVTESGVLHLQQLALINGRSATQGGAILNHGETRLDHVTLRRNEVYAFGGADTGQGGAIASHGTLRVQSSSFEDNQAYSEDTGEVRGGAIYSSGYLQMRNSTLNHNYTSNGLDSGLGGGLYNAGYAHIARSAFVRNTQGEYGYGAAIFNMGVLRLENATLSDNQPYYGRGALVNGLPNNAGDGFKQALLINVTIADNGNYGLINFASMVVRNSLVVGNSYFSDDSEVFVRNCLNQGSYFNRHGLMLGNDGLGCNADLPVNDALAFSQILEPLSNVPGAPPLHGLRAGSPAIDAGVGTCIVNDQRKLARPQDGNGDGVAGCDLGAYERAAP